MKFEMSHKKWDETPLDENKHWSQADVEFGVSGDFEGIAYAQYTMAYGAEGVAQYVGMMRFVGEAAGKKGAFIVKDEGVFEEGVAKSTLTVIEGSGIEDFAGITGEGGYAATHEGCTVTIHSALVDGVTQAH